MKKSDWLNKEKEFLDMLEKAKVNKSNVEKQIEELELFLEAIKVKRKSL